MGAVVGAGLVGVSGAGLSQFDGCWSTQNPFMAGLHGMSGAGLSESGAA